MHVLSRAMLALLVVAAVAATTAPAASGAIRITKIYYDSPGRDDWSNASLNDEWIRLRNTGESSRQLRDWSIRDAVGHVYWFDSLRLGAGRTVTVHTGDGSDSAAHRYWGSGNYVWNNTGDTATLRRPNGARADRCSYDDSGSASSVTC
jgi:hypothetical protein